MKTFQTGLLVLSLVLTPAAGAIAGLRGGRFEGTDAASNQATDVASSQAEGTESTGIRTAWNYARRVAGRLAGRITGHKQEPATPAEQAGEGGSGSYIFRVVCQLIFALIYYQVIVAHYPRLDTKPVLNAEAEALQNMDAVSACCHPSMSFPNAALSMGCTGPRAAHTFHSVGIMNYWLGCCLMTCFPCCTLFYTNACTDMNERMGGQRQNIFTACLCSFCCPYCLVAQDAQSLDLVTGTKTGFCYTL